MPGGDGRPAVVDHRIARRVRGHGAQQMRAPGKGRSRVAQRLVSVEQQSLDTQRRQLLAPRLAAAGARDPPALCLQHPGKRQGAIAEAETEQRGLTGA